MARRTRTSQRNPKLSATLQQVVEALRYESLRCAEGDLIGSEDELLARHRVSRPTLRQAALVVAQEQLLEVRRGVGGGYIAQRPTSRAVAHMAAIYLRTRNASRDELSRSTPTIRAELARLAAANLDDESRKAFQDFLRREAGASAEGPGLRAFTESVREFGQLLGASSGNRVLSLFLDILYDLGTNFRPEHDVFLGRPERVQAYRQQRARLIGAILDSDPYIAGLLANRTSELHRQWQAEDAIAPVAARPRKRRLRGTRFER